VEKGMVAPNDVVAKLVTVADNISAFGKYPACREVKTWEQVGACWNDMIKDRQEVSEAVKEIATGIAKVAKTETEKVEAVWRYMNQNIRYVGLERGLAGFIPLSAHVVCSKKYGDCKAVAGLTSVLCRELGLKADPILIGTRQALGNVDVDMPAMFYFNHSIARVEADGQTYFLDATQRTMDYKTTAHFNQGVHVVVARPGKPFLDFVPIQAPESNRFISRSVFTPSGKKAMKVDLEVETTGNQALIFRQYAHEYPGKKFQDYIADWVAESYPQAIVSTLSHTGKDDNEKPFAIKSHIEIPRAFQAVGSTLNFEVRPALAHDFDTLYGPLKRRYDMDIGYLRRSQRRYEVQIPKGMKLSRLPKNIVFEDDFFKLERMAQIENDRVVVVCIFETKQLKVPTKRYAEIRKTSRKVMDSIKFVLSFAPDQKKAT